MGWEQPGHSRWDAAGSFFSTAEPAAGGCAGGATEITGAAGLEDGPSGSLLNGALLCVRANTVPLLPAPHLPATSSGSGGCPTRKSLQNCCWQGTASEQAKGQTEEPRADIPRLVFSTRAMWRSRPQCGHGQRRSLWKPTHTASGTLLGSRSAAARRLQVSHSQRHGELQV